MQEKYTFTACGYLVAYVDIMGQRKRLNDLGDAFWKNKSDNEIREKLNDTNHQVNQFFASCNEVKDFYSTLIAQYNILINDIEMLCATDSALFYFKYTSNKLDNIIKTLAVILGIKILYLDCLSNRIPVRGGIEMGICAPSIAPGIGIYGAALGHAVELEKNAYFPRIVLGTYLMNYLLDNKNNSKTHNCVNKILEALIRPDIYFSINPSYLLDDENIQEKLNRARNFAIDGINNKTHSPDIKNRYYKLLCFIVGGDVATKILSQHQKPEKKM